MIQYETKEASAKVQSEKLQRIMNGTPQSILESEEKSFKLGPVVENNELMMHQHMKNEMLSDIQEIKQTSFSESSEVIIDDKNDDYIIFKEVNEDMPENEIIEVESKNEDVSNGTAIFEPTN